MKRRILSMLLVLVMLVCAAPVAAESDNDITVYISVSIYGELAESKDGAAMAYVPVPLSGKAEYTLGDAFSAVHSEYFLEGTEGYLSSVSEFGPGLEMFWGDDSGNFGYQINGGEETVSNLNHVVENGDFIDACIYKNLYPDTEAYSRFDLTRAEVYTGETLELTLSYVSGYDDSWNSVVSPCEGAAITIDGEETGIVTDEEGRAVIPVESTGSLVISAAKTKILGDNEVPAITAPVCVAEVKAHPAVEILHNIAAVYKQSITQTEDKVNLPWIIADMAVYEKLFPDSQSCLAAEEKEQLLKALVSEAEGAKKAGDLAKLILAFRGLGYDAADVYTEDFEKINLAEKLTDLCEEDNESVTNIYTLPYVIIALAQSDDYASPQQLEQLIFSALESRAQWQATDNGTDAMTPMLLALAPYYATDDLVKSAIDESLEILKAEQREDGLIDGFEGYEPASTGLAICAFSALGVDAGEVKNGEINMIDGLISTANEDLSGFPNGFATEQGFRGLLAWQLLKAGEGKVMYDFSDYPMEPADLSGMEYLPVIFNVSPKNTKVTIDGAEEVSEYCFDLDAGSYTYTASASGYKSETDTFEITPEELQAREPLTIKITLGKKTAGNGGSSSDTSHRSGTGIQSVTIPAAGAADEQEKPSAAEPAENIFPDVSSEDWYYSAVQYVCENNLFLGTGAGFEPDTPMSRAMLVTVLHRLAAPEGVAAENLFEDVDGDAWYAEGVMWAAENGIVTGVTATEFLPDNPITREQLAVILHRYAMMCGYEVDYVDADLTAFSDYESISGYALQAVEYAVSAGIMNGRDDGRIAPVEGATRAEVAAILMRLAQVHEK